MEKKNNRVSIFSLLNEGSIKDMCKSLKTTFLRMGVNVDFEISEKIIYDGSLLIKAISTPFNTMPVMFREVRVECEGRLRKNEENGSYEMDMSCYYRYCLFDGGTNGCNVGIAHFTIRGCDEKKENGRVSIVEQFEFLAEHRTSDGYVYPPKSCS